MSVTETEQIEDLDDEVEVKEEEIVEDLKPSTSGSVLFPTETKFSNIKNKHVRIQKFQKAKKEQKKAKKEAKKKRLQEGAPKKAPHTIESLRIKDETTVTNLEDEANELIRDDLEKDEFNEYYKQSYEPKVLITYADNPMRVSCIHIFNCFILWLFFRKPEFLAGNLQGLFLILFHFTEIVQE